MHWTTARLLGFCLRAGTALCLGMCLAGCHTVQGMGRDLEQGGQAMQEAAEPDRQPPRQQQVISPI
jgi:predicted small secreted protein